MIRVEKVCRNIERTIFVFATLCFLLLITLQVLHQVQNGKLLKDLNKFSHEKLQDTQGIFPNSFSYKK